MPLSRSRISGAPNWDRVESSQSAFKSKVMSASSSIPRSGERIIEDSGGVCRRYQYTHLRCISQGPERFVLCGPYLQSSICEASAGKKMYAEFEDQFFPLRSMTAKILGSTCSAPSRY